MLKQGGLNTPFVNNLKQKIRITHPFHPFFNQEFDFSLLLRKRSIEVDRVARSGPGMGKNAGACMNKLINTHDQKI